MPLGFLGLGVFVVSFSGIARMFISFSVKRKMLRVLSEASRGVLSAHEISERIGMSESSVTAFLNQLERRSYVVSGNLMPAGLKIYRVTSRGKDSLAAGSIP